MSKNVIGGYQKFAEEMIVLEPEDWSSAEWETLCKLCGLPALRTKRIVLHLSSIECYISGEQAGRE